MAIAAIELGHRLADELPELALDWKATPVPAPAIVVANSPLASELGMDPEWLLSDEGAAVLAGNEVPESARPVAMAYAGHQFGNYSPRLGDGRALLLGELVGPDGSIRDLHLKGTGRTPYARGGDGRAMLSSMLREFVHCEAMHALGIPTTRALAVVTTGEAVQRSRVEPGAVLARVAASHLRVGTVEYARWLDDGEHLAALVEHAIARHCPDAADAERPALALLAHTVEVQADLIAQWMNVGFIHGVMNTDNTTLSGETIDFGPCAYMDRFDPKTVFSSIDHAGRYAYGNQPAIAQWNLTRMAEALLPVLDDDRDTAVALATEVLEGFVLRYQASWAAGMAAKLGLSPDTADSHGDLFDGLLTLLADARADYTSTFRLLAASLRGQDAPLRASFPDHVVELDDWLAAWHTALGDADRSRVADAMDAVNPIYVPRNHLVEAALDAAAVDGDLTVFQTLLEHVTHPFEERPGSEAMAAPAPDDFAEDYITFCGT